MKIKIELTGDQEDAIVAQSLLETYQRNDTALWSKINKKDCKEIRKACRVLFNYYTGENLK